MSSTNLLQDEDRVKLCLAAVGELDKIARMLPGQVPLDEGQAHYAVKALAGRMLRLTGALLSGLGDECEATEKIRQVVDFDEGTGQG